MDEALAYLLDLRLRARGRPDTCALIDRCLLLLARAATADAATVAKLEAEVEDIHAELEAKYGPPRALVMH